MATDVSEVTEKAPATKPKVSARPAPKAEKQPGLPTAIRKGIAAYAPAEPPAPDLTATHVAPALLARYRKADARVKETKAKLDQIQQQAQQAVSIAATNAIKAEGVWESICEEIVAAYGPGRMDDVTGAITRDELAAEGGNQ